MNISESDVLRFTTGDCHYLARAIQKRTGWPMCSFSIMKGPSHHAFVRMPDGQYLDVEGVHSEEGLRKQWGGARHDTIAEFDWEAFLHTWRRQPRYGDHTYKRAKQIAQYLLEGLS